MTFQIIFILSGGALAFLILEKMHEVERRSPSRVLSVISRGDYRLREISHFLSEKYDGGKEEALFFFKREVPLHSKNIWNKTKSFFRQRTEKYIGNIRGSKYFRKDEGLSEFFKSISEKENGRIDETLDNPDLEI